MFSRTDANVDKAEGQTKETWGDLTGNSNLSARGQAQDASGDAQKTAATLSEQVQGGIGAVTGAAGGFLSSLTGGSNYTSDQPSHADGRTDNVLGQTKETFGDLTGNSSLSARGQAQDASGDAQRGAATLTDYVRDTAGSAAGYVQNLTSGLTGGSDYTSDSASKTDANIDKGAGNVKSTLGGLMGDSGLESRGDAQHASGEAQQGVASLRDYVSNVADSITGRDHPSGNPDPWRAE